MENQAQLISELREKFFKKLDEEGPPDPSKNNCYINYIIIIRE